MTGSMQGRVQFVSTNCTGIVIAAIILSAYSIRDFFKPIYAIWTIIALICAPIAIHFGEQYYPYKGQFVSAIINVCIYGYIVIRVILKQLKEKKSNIRWFVFFCWTGMVAWMLLSRNEAIWPLWFGIMFGCFYLSEYEPERKMLIYKGLIDGVILGFFGIQGAALLFRPYDSVRYLGMYLNCNINALFYVITYCAFLCKYLIVKEENKSLVIQVIMLLFSGAMFGFIVLTGSRSAMAALMVTMVPFLICVVKNFKKKWKAIMVYILALIAIAFFSIPITYLAVRYMPTIHLHPIFFMNEYNDYSKVHSGAPRNSERYITFEQMIEENLSGRFSNLFPKKISEAIDRFSPTLVAYAAELEGEETTYLIGDEGDSSGINIRYQIYKWYFERLNLFGHKNAEHGAPLSEIYTAPHAHNWWLQLSFNFGIPVGILLICGVVLYIKTFFSFLIKGKDEYACILGCFITAFLTFGFFEMDFGLGQLSFTLFFMLFALVLQKDSGNEEKEELVVND
jgi:O-antigen ligase